MASPIERAFAIDADPETIWAALWHDLSQGDAEIFDVESSTWPRSLSLRVDLGGMPSRLTYSIEPRSDHTEVALLAEALSWHWDLLLTVGH